MCSYVWCQQLVPMMSVCHPIHCWLDYILVNLWLSWIVYSLTGYGASCYCCLPAYLGCLGFLNVSWSMWSSQIGLFGLAIWRPEVIVVTDWLVMVFIRDGVRHYQEFLFFVLFCFARRNLEVACEVFVSFVDWYLRLPLVSRDCVTHFENYCNSAIYNSLNAMDSWDFLCRFFFLLFLKCYWQMSKVTFLKILQNEAWLYFFSL